MTHPPYFRWIVAGSVIALALWIELRPAATVEHPFLAVDVAAGEAVEVVWRTVPTGVFEDVETTGFAARDLTEGDPLLPSDVTTAPFAAPEDWWMIELDLPDTAHIGAAVQLVVLPEVGKPPQAPIPGVVVSFSETDQAFGAASARGSVAVAPDHAATAAVAIASQRISVLVKQDF